ncbi:hypothetical protein GCM10020256_71690 [Streptomyces thermocoprophilus]
MPEYGAGAGAGNGACPAVAGVGAARLGGSQMHVSRLIKRFIAGLREGMPGEPDRVRDAARPAGPGRRPPRVLIGLAAFTRRRGGRRRGRACRRGPVPR